MAATAVSDPYQILGVDANADSVAIKKAYRKLVLSCHPDKVTDESLKEQKQEEFHQIQQAYETVGDPDNRNKYELELKAKKLRDERERAAKTSPAQSRHVNINIFTAEPAEYRSSSSKYSPTKAASYKPYSGPEASKSWGENISSRSRGSYEDRKTRRTYSEEKLNEDTRERRRREDDRDRERRRRQQEEDDAQRRRQAKREKEAALEREREQKLRAREARKREEAREQQVRDDKAAQKKARERAERDREGRRRQDAEEKSRAKVRLEHSSEDDDERRSRSKKSYKKDSPRDKTPSKARARPSPREEVVPDVPEVPVADPVSSKMAKAADYAYAYIQQTKSKSTSAKVIPETSMFSEAYPDPNKTWIPRRRSSGEKQPTAEPAAFESTSSPISPSAGPSPPRLQKSYTMGYAPTAGARPSVSRSQTLNAEAFRSVRSAERAERPRLPRQRTAIVEDDDYYSTPVHKSYSIGRDKGLPRVFETSTQPQYHTPYGVSGGSFSKIKTAPTYTADHVSRSKRYDPDDITFTEFRTQQQPPYVAVGTHS